MILGKEARSWNYELRIMNYGSGTLDEAGN